MTDSRGGYDEDSLPWLQEVEDEDAPSGISARAMLMGFAFVVIAAAIVAAGFFWLGRRQSVAPGGPELIRAPEAPYKVKPHDPGGLDVAGESQTTFETSAGQDIDSRLQTDAPGEQVQVPPQPEPKRIPPNETKEPLPAETPKPPAPAEPSGASGSVIQLGAFANRAQAERAWSALSSRFSSVGGLNKMIVPYPGGIRLRAAASSPAQAREVCSALKAAGEACFIAR